VPLQPLLPPDARSVNWGATSVMVCGFALGRAGAVARSRSVLCQW